MRVRACLIAAALLAAASARAETSQGRTSFPARLESYMTDTALTAPQSTKQLLERAR